MILRTDYLQNRYSRVLANRQILKRIFKELKDDRLKRQVTTRLAENMAELRAIKFGMKAINIKPN